MIVAVDPEVVLVNGIEIEAVSDAALNDDSVEPGPWRLVEEILLCDNGVPDPAALAVDEASSVEDAAAWPVLVDCAAEFELAVKEGVDCSS